MNNTHTASATGEDVTKLPLLSSDRSRFHQRGAFNRQYTEDVGKRAISPHREKSDGSPAFLGENERRAAETVLMFRRHELPVAA